MPSIKQKRGCKHPRYQIIENVGLKPQRYASCAAAITFSCKWLGTRPYRTNSML